MAVTFPHLSKRGNNMKISDNATIVIIFIIGFCIPMAGLMIESNNRSNCVETALAQKYTPEQIKEICK